MSKVITTNSSIKQFIPDVVCSGLELVPYFWNLNGVYLSGDDLIVKGWALPHDGIKDGTKILVNGCEPDTIQFTDNIEVARLYPWWPNALRSSFELRIKRENLLLNEDQELEFTALPTRNDNLDSNLYRSFYLRLPDLSAIYPDLEIQARIGSDNSFHYALLGRTLYRQFDRAFKLFAGIRIQEETSIVDWGCGAGRVARHVIESLTENQRFSGFDIDSAAIDWANNNLGANFVNCETMPPLPCESDFAAVVYAYSVFTHLRNSSLKVWIAEIARIVQPGGFFLFTVLSDTAMLALLPYSEGNFLRKWKAEGIYDSIPNSQLSSIGVGNDYYRNVWFTQEYIRKNFNEYFEVLSIEQNFHFYQDLVVCRRRVDVD